MKKQPEKMSIKELTSYKNYISDLLTQRIAESVETIEEETDIIDTSVVKD